MEASNAYVMDQSELTQPKAIKWIIGLIIFKLFLSFGFYLVFAIKGIELGAATPTTILYTFLGYLVMSVPIFLFARSRNAWGLRISLIIDTVVSIPVTAVIGIVISLTSLGLTFGKQARAYLS